MRLEILLCSFYALVVIVTPLNILVLGGDGFLGSHLMNVLLDNSVNVTLLNRGNEYFASKKYIDPFVWRVINCDRKTLLRKTCQELVEPSVTYDAVVDFSSYNDKDIEQVIDILKQKVKLYIFISSDAVYEVRAKHEEGRTREEETDNNIVDKKLESTLIERNQYGANKLACEERLIDQREKFGFPYVILRLADAIGERDTTMRWWSYQLLIKIHSNLNITVPLPAAIMNQTFSMVYASDVAQFIWEVLNNPLAFHDQKINLAFEEQVTLRNLLAEIGAYLNVSHIKYENDERVAWFRYPSVQRGPIDITKAESKFEMKATNFVEALHKTCDFFENAMVEETYAKDRELFLAEFIEEVLPDDFTDDKLFTESLIKAYGNSVFRGIDLGFDVDIHQNRIEGKNEL